MANTPLVKPHHAPLRLLVVEDQLLERQILHIRLREFIGKESLILEAETGAEAMLKLSHAEQLFDCILLDMHLPDIDGLALIPMLLNLRPEVCIVMITAESDMDRAIQCLHAGAEDFLIKGEYSNAGLHRAIRYAMERHRTRIENLRLARELNIAHEFSAMQKEFIQLVSHEFRTPISMISGATQLLALKAPELYQGVGAPQFNKIQDAIERLLGLLDNVVRLNRMEEGKYPFQPEELDIQLAIQHACGLFPDSPIARCGITTPIPYYGDHILISYVVQNVVGNALKYSPSNAPVTIDLRTTPAGITVLIIDHGAGMSPQVLAQVGERFYRGDATSHIEGTGLGIYLARRFMEYHGGSLMFCSEAGQGTTVRLFFPH